MAEGPPEHRPGSVMDGGTPVHETTSPRRLTFAVDEARHPWLGCLLDAYHTLDQGVVLAIGRELVRGHRLACAKGCAACCRSHLTIPVYPLELLGIYWFVSEHLAPAHRSVLRRQLEAHRRGEACPFLVEEVCAIHPLRPAACRQFNVLDRVCLEGEDAYYTRRSDVVTPIRRFTDAAIARALPFYGVKDPHQQRKVLRSGQIHALAKVLQELDWGKLAMRLAETDQAHSEVRVSEAVDG